jgi:putative transposase
LPAAGFLAPALSQLLRDPYVFDSLQEVRDMTADWLHRYNHHRPHEALGRIPPVEYRVKLFSNLYF